MRHSLSLRVSALSLVCVIAVATLVRAQTAGHIRGRVVDDDGKPLAGVQVVATYASKENTTTTGKDGQYRFSMIPPGTYKVRFSMPKYSEVQKNATVRLDGTATVDAKLFRLEPSEAPSAK